MACQKVEYVNTISVADYNHLRKSVGWYEIALRQAQTGINNSAYIVAAMVGDKTVGMARLVSDGGYTAIVADVIVLPEFQGRGIGKTMMGMVMEFIKSNMTEGDRILVNLMAAKGREPFYKQFGFVERPNEQFGAGMTQWILK